MALVYSRRWPWARVSREDVHEIKKLFADVIAVGTSTVNMDLRANTDGHAILALQYSIGVSNGDAFTAAMALGLLASRPLGDINRHANEVAAYVCSQPGATPVLPASFRADW